MSFADSRAASAQGLSVLPCRFVANTRADGVRATPRTCVVLRTCVLLVEPVARGASYGRPRVGVEAAAQATGRMVCRWRAGDGGVEPAADAGDAGGEVGAAGTDLFQHFGLAGGEGHFQ